MMRFSHWTVLAMAGVLLSTSSADAFGGRKRRGCNGGGGGCHGSYSGGHGGCHGGVYSGGHGGCHGGGVMHGGCHGSGGVIYRDSGTQGGTERVAPPRKSGSEESSSNSQDTGAFYFSAPEGAQIWVDGQEVQRRGDNWYWTSPALTNRRNFEVRARWNDNGRVVTRTRSVPVDAGGRVNFDFTRPEGSEIRPVSGDLNRDTTPRTTTTPRDTNPAPLPKTNININTNPNDLPRTPNIDAPRTTPNPLPRTTAPDPRP